MDFIRLLEERKNAKKFHSDLSANNSDPFQDLIPLSLPYPPRLMGLGTNYSKGPQFLPEVNISTFEAQVLTRASS